MDKQITILHLWSSFKGDYELFNQVVMGLTDGYRHIVCYLTGEPPAHEILADAGYDVRWLGFKKKSLRRLKGGVVKQLLKIVVEDQVDIIHAHRHKSTSYAALTARKHDGLKVVSSVHGLERSRGLVRKISNRFLWPRVNKIIAVSEAVKKDILTENTWFPEERVEVVYNGINIEHFQRSCMDKLEARRHFSLPEQAWLWGAVGRLAPVKGHDILLKAWADADLGKLGCHLALAGEGNLRDNLTSLAAELGIADQVSFVGHITEVPQFLKALDGFVMPSLHEGFGLALVEALAAGLPAVASAVGGIPEILQDLQNSKCSCLVPAGKTKELAAALQEIVEWSPEQRQQALLHIPKSVRRFTAREMIDRMGLIYQDLSAA